MEEKVGAETNNGISACALPFLTKFEMEKVCGMEAESFFLLILT